MKTRITFFAVTLLVVTPLGAQQPQALSINDGSSQPLDARPDDRLPTLGGVYSSAEIGLHIDSVYTNGPLHQHDGHSEDTISQVDGIAVNSEQDLVRLLLGKNPGDRVVVTRIRDGVAQDIVIRLISRTELRKVSNTKNQPVPNISRQYVGTDSWQVDDSGQLLIHDRLHNLGAEAIVCPEVQQWHGAFPIHHK